MLVLGGDLKRAEQLEESCYKMWMLHGIEPEEFNYNTNEVKAANYVLRPEIIESAYYPYKLTNNEKYLEMGITFFESIVKYSRIEEGYAALKSVITKEKDDQMENFFFAETLKY